MNIELENFLLTFSLQSIIFAIIASVIDYVAEKTFCKNAPRFVKNFAPFFITVLLSVCYDSIFTYKRFSVCMDSIASGLIAGGLSTVISVLFKKIVAGETVNLNPSSLLIEGLLEGYVNDNDKAEAVEKINELIMSLNNDELNDDNTYLKIAEIIKQYAKTILQEKDLEYVVKIIIQTIKSKKEK